MRAKNFNWRIAILAWFVVLCFDAGIASINQLDATFFHKVFPIFIFPWMIINAPGVFSLALGAALIWGNEVATVKFGTTYFIIAMGVISATFWSAVFGFISAHLTKRSAGNGGAALVDHTGRTRLAVPDH